MLSLLIGKQLALDEASMSALVEAALLHDIGKTKIPLDIVKKPGALDKRERRMIEAHTTLGAEVLVQTDGLRPLTPTVALEHHRGVKGTGYPDLGDAVPHLMSQIVSVADIYEAITGARSYQNPTLPEHACLVLARLAGEKLNTSLVKAFVNAITFFPIGSVVRTSREEIGVVVERTPDPLHPILSLVDSSFGGPTAAWTPARATRAAGVRPSHRRDDAPPRGPRSREVPRSRVITTPAEYCLEPLLLPNMGSGCGKRAHPAIKLWIREEPHPPRCTRADRAALGAGCCRRSRLPPGRRGDEAGRRDGAEAHRPEGGRQRARRRRHPCRCTGWSASTTSRRRAA